MHGERQYIDLLKDRSIDLLKTGTDRCRFRRNSEKALFPTNAMGRPADWPLDGMSIRE
jgi:hypothetical protein